jgi:quinol monooxygenase YgiN
MFQAHPERGFLDCQLYTENANSRSYFYREQWATREDMDRQLRSESFGMLLAIMETAPKAPSLEVRTTRQVSDHAKLLIVKTAVPTTTNSAGCFFDDGAARTRGSPTTPLTVTAGQTRETDKDLAADDLHEI